MAAKLKERKKISAVIYARFEPESEDEAWSNARRRGERLFVVFPVWRSTAGLSLWHTVAFLKLTPMLCAHMIFVTELFT